MNHPAAARNAEPVPNYHVSNYQVHLNGVLPGHDVNVVAAALAPRFKRSVEQLTAILNGPMIVLKRGIDRQTAEQYVTALTKAGCACSMHQQTVAPAPVPVRLVKAVPAAEQPIVPAKPDGPPAANLAMAVNGQTLGIDAILIFIAAVVFPHQTTGQGLKQIGMLLAVLSVLGVVRIVIGLRLSLPVRVLRIALAFIPVISFISFIALSMQVSKQVRAEGYEVGRLGVNAHERDAIVAATPGQPHYSRAPSVLVAIAIVLIHLANPASLP